MARNGHRRMGVLTNQLATVIPAVILAPSDPCHARAFVDSPAPGQGNSDAPPAGKIFVNYRVDDEPFGAALIDHDLSQRFGSAVVFRASKSIPLGEDYVKSLLAAVRAATIMLAVIGPRWLRAPQQDGQCRRRDGTDWAQREIAEAFRCGIRVIPVLMNADLPKAIDLPPDIAALSRCQYYRIHYRNSHRDLSHLAEQLTTLTPGLTAPRQKTGAYH